jgi:hypothetical protein
MSCRFDYIYFTASTVGMDYEMNKVFANSTVSIPPFARDAGRGPWLVPACGFVVWAARFAWNGRLPEVDCVPC